MPRRTPPESDELGVFSEASEHSLPCFALAQEAGGLREHGREVAPPPFRAKPQPLEIVAVDRNADLLRSRSGAAKARRRSERPDRRQAVRAAPDLRGRHADLRLRRL